MTDRDTAITDIGDGQIDLAPVLGDLYGVLERHGCLDTEKGRKALAVFGFALEQPELLAAVRHMVGHTESATVKRVEFNRDAAGTLLSAVIISPDVPMTGER
jgi:hypothetical protein